MEKNLILKNDVKMPPRIKIRQELKKVSEFTEKEISIMWWSSLYKAYSLIVRYGQKGVEDEFRKEEWFQNAMNENNISSSTSTKITRNNNSEIKYNHEPSTQKTSESKKIFISKENMILFRQKKKESKKIIDEIKLIDRPRSKELKKMLRLQKKQFKSGEISIENFTDFISKLLVSAS